MAENIYNLLLEQGYEVEKEKEFDRFGGEIGLSEQVKRDKIKKKLCEDNGIKLFYITKRNNNINEIISYINEGCREEKKASEKT